MLSRQRVKASIDFKKPDRIACGDNIWPDTLRKWREQGMPEAVSAEDYFGFDICSMSIDCSPGYEQKIIGEDDIWYEYMDRWGYSAKKKKAASSSMHFFDHKTIDREEWEKSRHKWSLDKTGPARIDKASYFEHFSAYPSWEQAADLYKKIYSTNRYMHFVSYGPWEATWRHRGYESLLMDVALHPLWVKDMAEAHIDLLIDVIRYCLELGMRPDGFYMVEDLAETRGLLFSPDTWREVFMPAVNKLGRYLRSENIDFWMHCCGNIRPLIPDLIQCGLKVLNPLQVSAGMDIRELKKEYDGKLAFYGNISVPVMSEPLDVLEEEIRSKVSLAKEGGYVYHSDHSIPPNISLERYEWILGKVLEYGT